MPPKRKSSRLAALFEPDLAESLVAPDEALRLTGGLSFSIVRRLIRDGAFPAPIVLTRTPSGRPGRIAFVRSELDAWVRGRIEAERGGMPSGQRFEAEVSRPVDRIAQNRVQPGERVLVATEERKP